MSEGERENRPEKEKDSALQTGDETGGGSAGDSQGTGDSGQADTSHHNDPDDMIARPGTISTINEGATERAAPAEKKSEARRADTPKAAGESTDEPPRDTDGVLINSDAGNAGTGVLAATGLAAITPAFGLVSREDTGTSPAGASVYERPDKYARGRETESKPARSERSDAARGGGSEAEASADDELKSPFKSAAHDQNKNGGYRIAGETDPNISEEERRKRQQQIEDDQFKRSLADRDAGTDEKKAGFKQTDGEEQANEAGAGSGGGRGYLNYGNREISDYELRKAIIKAVTKNNWDTLYFYKGSKIDPVLTARAEQMLAKLQGPKGVLAGTDVQISRLPMRDLEPWKWDIGGLRAARHEKSFDKKYGGPEVDIANRHKLKPAHQETTLASPTETFKHAADPREKQPEMPVPPVITREPDAGENKGPDDLRKAPALDLKGP